MKPSPPHPDKWVKYLQESYDTNTFCNFGPAVVAFQNKLQKYLGSKHPPVVACNATAALEVVLLALDLQNTEVLIPTFTFAATAHSVERAGAVPVFVDSTENTWHICLEDAAKKLSPKTRAMVVVNPFGMLIDIKGYQDFAKEHGLKLIFDSAAAFGAVYPNGNRYSEEIEIYSFHVTKTMGIGEGAAIFAPDQKFLQKCLRTANFGFNDDSLVEYQGTNSKMSDFQAAVGIAKLEELNKSLYLRQNHAGYYNFRFELKTKKVLVQNNFSLENHTYPFFPIRYLGDTVHIKQQLKDKQIGFRQYYQPLHIHPYFSKYSTNSYPIADELAKSVFCLPCYDSLTLTDMNEVTGIFI